MSAQSALSSQLILVTGPARSGKSEWAETLAKQAGKPVIYVATALVEPTDLEWCDRIEQHRRRRPCEWTTVQEPVHLVDAIQGSPAGGCLLVDSLGTWVANLLEQDDATWERIVQALLDSLEQVVADTIFVAEETGWGVIPAYPTGRTFRDRLGALVRRVGAIANSVYLVTGGYALDLSRLGSPLPPHRS
jgi:adenosylcobinamide kinase / adenosylcobinamide-phosphate guanylyltransferase